MWCKGGPTSLDPNPTPLVAAMSHPLYCSHFLSPFPRDLELSQPFYQCLKPCIYQARAILSPLLSLPSTAPSKLLPPEIGRSPSWIRTQLPTALLNSSLYQGCPSKKSFDWLPTSLSLIGNVYAGSLQSAFNLPLAEWGRHFTTFPNK